MKHTRFLTAKILPLLLLVLVAGCAPSPAPSPAVTPVPTGEPPAVVAAEPTPAPYQVVWTFQTGGPVWSSPAVDGNVVYAGSDDGALYAVDAVTGGAVWQFATGGLVRSRPAIAAGVVYVASDDGFLYALDAGTGQERWRSDIGNAATPRILPAKGSSVWDYLQSSPTVAEGMVYVGSADGNLYALDAATGKEQWRLTTGGLVRSSPAVAAGVVYVGSWDGNVYAVDARTGQEIWRFDTGGRVQPSPTVVDGTVYVGGKTSYLYALDAQTGEVEWRFRYQQTWVESSATVVEDTLYIGSSLDDTVYALDSESGEKMWEFPTVVIDGSLNATMPWSTPAAADGVVYAGGVSYASDETRPVTGYLFAVDARSGQEKWHLTTGPTLQLGGVASSPAVAGGVVYFGSLDGQVYALRPAVSE